MLLRIQFRAQKTARASPPLASVVRSRTRTPAAMRWSLALTTVRRLRKTAAIAAKHTRPIPGTPSDHVIAGSSAHCRYVGALIPAGTTRTASAGSRTSNPRSTLCMGSVAATVTHFDESIGMFVKRTTAQTRRPTCRGRAASSVALSISAYNGQLELRE